MCQTSACAIKHHGLLQGESKNEFCSSSASMTLCYVVLHTLVRLCLSKIKEE